MQITNYWAQPQIPHNKASASAVSATDLLNLTAKNSASNNSGSANSSQSVISGPSPTTSFSASLAATSVDTASTETATSTNPDFTNMSDQQMGNWVISQVASGAMTKEQSSPFLTLAVRMQDSPLTGGNIANTTVPHNFIDEAKQYVASDDHATARFIKPALDMMLRLQSQSSHNIGASLSLDASTESALSRNAASSE